MRNTVYVIFVKNLSCFLLFLYCNACLSQPVITSISPSVASIGTSVIIAGNNFNPIAVNNVIYFGAAKANITSATSSSLTATVPSGATYGRISLTTNGFTCFSVSPFNVTSGQVLTDSSFNTKNDFSSGLYPEFIARGDFDGDGLADMAVSNWTSSSISVFHNTSTPGSVSFGAASDYGTGIEPEAIKIDDINSDGKPDIIVTSISDHLFTIFLNTSTIGNISFAPRADHDLGNSNWPRGIDAGDIDGDGKVDIVTADNNKIIDFINNTSHGTVSVSRNTGSGSPVSFASPVSFNTGIYPRSVSIADIDGDTKPDLAVANHEGYNVSVFLNNSTPGNINLSLQQTLPLQGYGQQVIMGDIDGDGKIDMIVSDLFGTPLVSVFRNTSSPGSISFAAPFTIATDSPIGLSIGDIDGDAKPDLAVANYNSGAISVLINTSLPGNISFATQIDFKTGSSLVDVKIGDVDGDMLPDLTLTNANNNIVSVLRFTAKPPPQQVLNLGSDTALCGGDSVILKTNIANAQYLWNTGAITDKIIVKQAGNYWVKVTSANAILYDTIAIRVYPKPVVLLGNDTLLCKGSGKMLNAFNAGATYLWNNGSSSSSINITTGDTYFVTVTRQGCIQRDTIVIAYDSIPDFTLGPDAAMCDGQSLVLNPGINGANILWQDGTTAPIFSVTQPGIYTASITNGCGSANDEIQITGGNCNVYIPSAFTPNYDHLNDILKPVIYGVIISLQFQIFDRYGKLVFSTNDRTAGWNGKFNGIDSPSGIFVWRCLYQLQGSKPASQKGSVMLIR